MIPVEQVNAFEAEMKNAGADWQVIVYGGAKHSFTNPVSDSLGMPGIGYNKLVDARSWKAMSDFFEENIRGLAARSLPGTGFCRYGPGLIDRLRVIPDD